MKKATCKEKKDGEEGKAGKTGRGNRTFRAFANRSFACLWMSNCLSCTSRLMQLTLLAWLILELTDSPWHVALVGFFSMFPMLALGLVGGVLADEMDRRRLLLITQTVSVAASLGLTLLLAAGVVQVWQAYLTVLINGASWALSFPSRRALIFDLMGVSGVTNAVALDSLGLNFSRMIGPGLGGILITLTGVAGGYGVVTLFYAIGFVLLWPMQVHRMLQKKGRDGNFFFELIEGFRYIRRSPPILAAVWITVVMNLLLFPYGTMVPVMARDVLHVGPTLMGSLQAAEGLGALIGGTLIASAMRINYHGRFFIGGSLQTFIALCAFSMSRWYVVSFSTLLCLGLGLSGFSGMHATIVMLAANEKMRGKALGVISIAIGAAPLGALLLGAVAGAVSPTFALRINSLAGIFGLTGIAVMLPSILDRTQTT